MLRRRLFGFPLLGIACALGRAAAQETAPARPEDTEAWQPVPPIVAPGAGPPGGGPPADAIVLFDSDDLDEWVDTRNGAPAGWTLRDGYMGAYGATRPTISIATCRG